MQDQMPAELRLFSQDGYREFKLLRYRDSVQIAESSFAPFARRPFPFDASPFDSSPFDLRTFDDEAAVPSSSFASFEASIKRTGRTAPE